MTHYLTNIPALLETSKSLSQKFTPLAEKYLDPLVAKSHQAMPNTTKLITAGIMIGCTIGMGFIVADMFSGMHYPSFSEVFQLAANPLAISVGLGGATGLAMDMFKKSQTSEVKPKAKKTDSPRL